MPVSVFALRIDNPKITIELSVGQNYSDSIMVTNPSQEAVAVKAYLEDFAYVSPFDGEKSFHAPGTGNFSLANWISFSPQEFTISPYGRQKVNLSIRPDTEFSFVHCGVLFFETSIGVTYEAGKAINVLGRIGSLIFVEPKGKTKQASLQDVEGSIRSLGGNFTNSGNSFLHVQGVFYVMNKEGMIYDRGQIQELYLLPGDTASVAINLAKDLSAGIYTMVVTFDMEDDDALIKEIDFSLDSSGKARVLEARD
jgi:hypothetical protein